MAPPQVKKAIGNSASTTLSSSVSDSATSAPLTSDTNFSAESGEGMVIVGEETATPEFAYATGKTGSSLTIPLANRGLEGGSAVGHASGETVKGIITAGMWNDFTESYLAEHNDAGTHKELITLKGTAAASAEIRLSEDTDNGTNYMGIKAPAAITSSVTLTLPDGAGSANQVLTTDGSGTLSWSSASGGTAYWTTVAGTPTRASDTQFTVTDTSNANKYDLLFKKGVILKWLESTTVNVGMVISSSYGTNTVTVNILGDSLTAGFTDMKYCLQMAQIETFIVPGTLAAGTDIAKTWYTSTGELLLSADAYVKTAGTTNATVFDINDDGTTRFTTKPSIASAGTSDIDNVADTPTTEVAAGSLVTVDIDSVSTTAPVEAYVYLYHFPSSWLYRS